MTKEDKKLLPAMIAGGLIAVLIAFHTPTAKTKEQVVDEQIKSIQDDIKARTTSIYYTAQSNKITAEKGVRAFREGVTNPMGATEDNKEDYAEAIKDVKIGKRLIEEDLAGIEEDKKKIVELRAELQEARKSEAEQK
jgi:hypothetical protein